MKKIVKQKTRIEERRAAKWRLRMRAFIGRECDPHFIVYIQPGNARAKTRMNTGDFASAR